MMNIRTFVNKFMGVIMMVFGLCWVGISIYINYAFPTEDMLLTFLAAVICVLGGYGVYKGKI